MRFFMLSRFDFPFALQGPRFDSVVFDLQAINPMMEKLLEGDGPGRESCDCVIAVYRDDAEGNPTAGEVPYQAVSEADVVRAVRPRGPLDIIGDSGRYRVYHVPSG
jgi:hypothetical protein